MPTKPSIPYSIQNRNQMHNQMPNQFNMANFTANQMVSMNPSMMPYTQNYFGNQTPGFVANNFPTSSNAVPIEPPSRRKSIIENINPFISEKKVLPADLLSAFPVSCTYIR